MTTIINQYGIPQQGTMYDEILDAFNKGIMTIVYSNKKVVILESSTDDNGQIIKVEVS